MELHVDASDFQSSVQQIELKGELLDRLARGAHEVFLQKLRDEGYSYGAQTSVELKTHSSMKPFDELSEEEKEQNRSNVRDMSDKLAQTGYEMVLARSNGPPFEFPGADLEQVARMEHERWMR